MGGFFLTFYFTDLCKSDPCTFNTVDSILSVWARLCLENLTMVCQALKTAMSVIQLFSHFVQKDVPLMYTEDIMKVSVFSFWCAPYNGM